MSEYPACKSFDQSSLFPLCGPKTWQAEMMLPFEKNNSSDTVHHTYHNKPSLSSRNSFGSVASRHLRVANENVSPSRTASLSALDWLGSSVCLSPLGNKSKPISHKPSWGGDNRILNPAQDKPVSICDVGPLEDIDLNARCDHVNQSVRPGSEMNNWQSSDHGLSFEFDKETLSTKKLPATGAQYDVFGRPPIVVPDTASNPVRRLLRSLRHRHAKRKRSLSVRKERWSLDEFDENLPAAAFPSQHAVPSGHKKASSWASSGFVTAVKSATTNLGTLSAPQSQITRRFAPLRNSKRSNKFSQVTHQELVTGNQDSTWIVDEAAWDRAVQRRRTLEELISSEESYIADLKVLKNVYFTLLASAQNVSMRTSAQIFRNVEDILNLHEELLLHIKFVVPNSELRSEPTKLFSKRHSKHALFPTTDELQATSGWESVAMVRRSAELSWFGRQKRDILTSEPREVAEVAKAFGRFMLRFFVYEEYGAKYEMMLRDLTSTSRSIPNWHAYERGIEALANSLASTNTQGETSRKGLTFEDLLIKPIQRICKYPLLFDDLYRYTPVIDGPDPRAEVEKVLCRMRETTQEINKATNDPQAQARIKRSWRLQDLLVIPDAPAAPPSLRLLGHANLCGVLYVAYQTVDGLRGDYTLCILFKSYLLLAFQTTGTRYETVAIISLGDVRIDRPDNGRGLQCHNALHTWKLIFESDQRLYELILCASSLREEEQWKTSLIDYSLKEAQRQMEDQSLSSPLYTVLCLSLKSLGNIFGLPGTLTRRISIQRAATISPRTNLCRVIIRNTTALKDHNDFNNTATPSIGRSQSLLSTSRIPILSPKRSDRLHMECALADVWTRDLLPFPGMSVNRGEHLIRASASSVMRKLSRASLASNCTKRSTSLAILTDDKSGRIDVQSANKEKRSNGPCLQSSQSTDSLTSWKPEDEALSTPSSFELAPRATLDRGTIAIHDEVRTGTQQEIEPPTEWKANVKSTNSAKTLKERRSRPNLILKAFSVEGIRGWLA